MKVIKKLVTVVLIFSIVLGEVAYADVPYVNVLTWWGYLDSPWISQQVMQTCKVKLSYDSYNSNDEFLRRWQEKKSDYDVIIFSYTIYSAIKNEIALKNSDISNYSRLYNPIIRQHFLNSHFSNNIAYFQHTLTGFIWNPKIINLSDTDDTLSIFKKGKSNAVIVIDDPVETEMLTVSSGHAIGTTNTGLTSENFRHMTQDTKVFVSNEINKVYDQDNFAFAYQWSGIWIAEYKQKRSYRFLVNKHLSYIASDLVAQVKDNKNALCVSRLLSSKKFLTKLQNESYYFSPYGDIDNVTDADFKDLYADFLNQLPRLSWIKATNNDHLKALTQRWSAIKYEIAR